MTDDEFAMLRTDVSLVIHYLRAITETMGITERLRVAEDEHKRKTSELSGRSLWAANGHHEDDRPTDPAPGGPAE